LRTQDITLPTSSEARSDTSAIVKCAQQRLCLALGLSGNLLLTRQGLILEKDLALACETLLRFLNRAFAVGNLIGATAFLSSRAFLRSVAPLGQIAVDGVLSPDCLSGVAQPSGARIVLVTADDEAGSLLDTFELLALSTQHLRALAADAIGVAPGITHLSLQHSKLGLVLTSHVTASLVFVCTKHSNAMLACEAERFSNGRTPTTA
jgi:hypothetical protein